MGINVGPSRKSVCAVLEFRHHATIELEELVSTGIKGWRRVAGFGHRFEFCQSGFPAQVRTNSGRSSRFNRMPSGAVVALGYECFLQGEIAMPRVCIPDSVAHHAGAATAIETIRMSLPVRRANRTGRIRRVLLSAIDVTLVVYRPIEVNLPIRR